VSRRRDPEKWMTAILQGLAVFAIVLGGALVGMALRRVMPEHHRATESKELIRSIMALIGTMSALVLGLLVGSAKSAYDERRAELTGSEGEILLLDRVLALYGPEAQPVREELRGDVALIADRIWHPKPGEPAKFDRLYEAVSGLQPKNDAQRELRAEATSLFVELSRSRWLLAARQGTAISTPLLVVVVFWLSVNFLSFGLFATRNSTVMVALIIGALSVATAVYLILELDSPFRGLLRISEEPMRAVIAQIGR
jgi:hypothetical protein